MTAGLAMPTQSYQLMLADPFTTADYTDITGLCIEWEGDVVGRQHELQLFQNADVQLTLNNRDGRFSPWNLTGPYYNVVSPSDDLTNGVAPALTVANGTKALAVPPVILDTPGNVVPEITGNGSSPTSGFVTGQYAVVAGSTYTAMLSFLTSVTARACTVTITWYKSDGVTVISTTTGSAVNDTTASWTKGTVVATTAPALAAFAVVGYSIASVSNAEVHWLCRAALFNAVANLPNTAWGPGQRGLVPARQVRATATWSSVAYPVFGLFVSNWTPTYGQVKANQVIELKDGLALLAQDDVSTPAYANQILADGATYFWRLGDPFGSGTAADNGPNNSPLTANFVQFGQSSPLLTDDTTSGLFASSGGGYGSLYGGPSPAAGAQTIEFLFNMPTQTGQAEFFSTSNSSGGGAIAWSGGNFLVFAAPNGSGSTAQGTFSAPTADDGNWHILQVVCSAATNGTVKAYLDGVLIGTATASGGGSSSMTSASTTLTWGFVVSSGVSYAYNGQMADIAFYPSAITASQAANHFALFSAGFAVQYSGQRIAEILTVLGWPASLYSVATGIQQVQGATSSLTTIPALSYMQTVTSTEQGALFCDPRNYGLLTFLDRHYIITATAATVSNCTLANDGAGGHLAYQPGITPAMDDLDLWTDVPGQRIGGVVQRSTSTLSAKQYVKRTLTGYTGLLQTNDNDVLAMTQWLLQHYYLPYTRVRSVTLSSVSGAGANLPNMLGRGALDLVTVNWRPTDVTSATTFTQASLIESVHHKVTQEEWQTTWGLSPAETQPYMILNDAVRGQLSEGNLLAY